MRLAAEAEALIVREVQVQHVELGEAHAVEGSLECAEREEAARHVQHQPAPRIGGMVVDAPDRVGLAGELGDGGEGVDGAPLGGGANRHGVAELDLTVGVRMQVRCRLGRGCHLEATFDAHRRQAPEGSADAWRRIASEDVRAVGR